MRIGSALVFLVATWIGLGYLFSENSNMHRDLTEAQQESSQLLEENILLQAELERINSENEAFQTQNSILVGELVPLREKYQSLEVEIKRLNDENVSLKNQLDLANSEKEIFRDQAQQVAGHVVHLQDQVRSLQAENNELQTRLGKFYKLNEFVSSVADRLRQQPYLALLIPTLPTSIAVGYIVIQHKNNQTNSTVPEIVKRRRYYVIKVTQKELKQIEHYRRRHN